MNKIPVTHSLDFIEETWERFRQDPGSVSSDWRDFFEELEADPLTLEGEPPAVVIGRRQLAGDVKPGGTSCDTCGRDLAMAALQHRVDQLIRNFRVRGHLIAKINPLGNPTVELPELALDYYGFVEADRRLEFPAGALAGGGTLPLGEIIERLLRTYCGSIGVQFMHIDGLAEREWLQRRFEEHQNTIALDRDAQVRILRRLTDAVVFESFLQTKFVGAKSFSLEGAETLIPLLDMVVEKAGRQGVEEIVMGMPHRGRLNVLANIMGKHPRQIFREFKDEQPEQHVGRGDVRYHLGYHRDWQTVVGGIIHLALAFNPSHLEYVCPVSQGRLRAKMDRMGDRRRERGLLVLIHGDASFAGEGIIQETLNLSRLPAYEVGGTLHVIVNNQIGFTTTPEQGRSCTYATDVARMLQVPVFHVDGEQPEAVAQAVELALDFRREFGQDAVIDMYCYRRRGHNEADEPTFTQPLMYKEIKRHPTVRESYLKQLVSLNELTQGEAQEIADERRAFLETEYANARPTLTDLSPDRQVTLGHIWSRYRGGRDEEVAPVDTAVEGGVLVDVLERIAEVPDDFHPHRKIAKLLDARRAMSRGEQALDWGTAEALAFATLALEGTRVRLTGQDSERGTFSHRHAVLHDAETGARYEPLNKLAGEQAPVEIVNSPLCEGGVLGFEYGYSLSRPDGLVIWEAQFGDFANAAQVYIDQFIAAAEEKWAMLSGLVMLLPHALEGTGPEHASARIERFLSLAAQDNFQLVYPTTPAQYFHCLRRQALSLWRKPLVVFSPKGLLRHPGATSTIDELSGGGFERVLSPEISGPVERVILTSGKLFYELETERDRLGRDDVPIVRIEQLHPLPWSLLEQTLAPFPDGTPVVWVQEEPANMGAYTYLRINYGDRVGERWPFHEVCRPASTTPASGSAASHKLEQQALLARAFGPLEK